jgi:hypothetical protein
MPIVTHVLGLFIAVSSIGASANSVVPLGELHIPLSREEVERNPGLVERYRALNELNINTENSRNKVLEIRGKSTRLRFFNQDTRVKLNPGEFRPFTERDETRRSLGQEVRANDELKRYIAQVSKALAIENSQDSYDFRVLSVRVEKSRIDVYFAQFLDDVIISGSNAYITLEPGDHQEDGATVINSTLRLIDIDQPAAKKSSWISESDAMEFARAALQQVENNQPSVSPELIRHSIVADEDGNLAPFNHYLGNEFIVTVNLVTGDTESHYSIESKISNVYFASQPL